MELLFRQNTTKQQSNLHIQRSLGHLNWLFGRSSVDNRDETALVAEVYWNSSRIVIGLILFFMITT